MQPHKHVEVIKAWADGAEIEYSAPAHFKGWKPIPFPASPSWHPDYNYRVKPESNPDSVQLFCLSDRLMTWNSADDNVRATFDGETGKLKSVEIIK